MLDCFQFEVHSNCVEKVLIERIVGISKQQTRLSNATISNKKHLKQVVTRSNETRKLERQDLAALYGVSLFQFDSKTLSSSECGISRVSRVFYLIVPKVLDTFFGTQDRRR